MMSISRFRLVTAAPAAAILSTGLVLLGTVSAAPSARLEYKLPKSTTLGEPAILLARLYNTTGYRITVDFGVDDQTEFVFRHTRPDGTLVTVQPSVTRVSRIRTSHLMLRGNTNTVAVVLDQWLDLSALGRHQIDIEFRGSVQLEGGDGAAVNRTGRLSIDITARDPKRLEKHAGEWLKAVSTLSQSSETRAAGTALAVMADPIAIPYLELAATRTRSAKFVDALASRTGPEARGALERLARSTDPEVRALAQKAIGK